MRLLACCAALAALVVASCGNQGSDVQVTLAAGPKRECAGEVQITPVFMKDVPQAPPPQTNALTQNFTATKVADGYLFEQSGNSQMGDVMLRATVSDAGEVRTAELSGGGLGAFMNPNGDTNRLAMVAARSIPERLVMGRTIKVGDELYPAALVQELTDTMSAQMGLPPGFSLTVTAQIPFKGAQAAEGRQVLVFEGAMQVNGNGDQGGQPVVMTMPTNVRYSFDAATGLLRETTTDGEMSMSLNGERQLAMRMRQTMSCTISGS
ncbi:MAG: hypothetical protein ABL883_04510 [Terricaulis sp.]